MAGFLAGGIMNIGVIGTGYVGLITACGFAKLGHNINCVDIDQKKVDMINNGITPIYEDGLEELLKRVVGKNLKATTRLNDAVKDSEIIFITVGTPSNKDGSIDISYVKTAFLEVLSSIRKNQIIVIKSTVVPGTTESLAKTGKEKTGKKANEDYGLCTNPEFLREGKALEDFMNPDKIVLGTEDKIVMEKMLGLYSSFTCPIIKTNARTSEMIKYANNSFLATKISFANEIGNLCKKLDIDVYEIMDAIGLDTRIERSFLNAGIGYGGSCFPKDVKALLSTFKNYGVKPEILQAVVNVNEQQPQKIIELAKKKINLKNAKVTVLGLAFKPDSDDIREAPSIKIIEELLNAGTRIIVYDPKAMGNTKKMFGKRIEYANTLNEAVVFSDTIFVLTEWSEFKDEKLYIGKMVFDGRRILKRKTKEDYEGVCW